MFTLGDVEAALPIVRAAVPPTPQYAWPLLCARVGAEVFVKHENHTPIGAFKLRGGLVYLDRLKRERPHIKGIVSATRGNHGQSLAFAAQRAGLPVKSHPSPTPFRVQGRPPCRRVNASALTEPRPASRSLT